MADQVFLVHRVQQVHKDLPGLRVLPVLLVHKVLLARKVQPVLTVLPVLKVIQDHKALKVL